MADINLTYIDLDYVPGAKSYILLVFIYFVSVPDTWSFIKNSC